MEPSNGEVESSIPWVQFEFGIAPQCLYTSISDYRDISSRLGPQIPQRKQPLDENGVENPEKVQNRIATRSTSNDNFLKGALWSPDGSCLLSNADDNVMRVYDLPPDCLEAAPENLQSTDSLVADIVVREGETVYDYAWFPYMNAAEPASCCFVTTSRAHPVHLWDAVSGTLRCTYRGYDHLDEITAAFSVAFNSDGNKIYCGYNKAIRVFDVNRPGRDCKTISTHNKKHRDGQAGILSTMAFNPDRQGMLAVGSYNRTTGIYMADTGELLYVLHGQQGGVTQVQWSADGNFLYTGARKDPCIMCWDVRFSQDVVYSINRDTPTTNQRVTFDIEPCGRTLCTGGEDGHVRIYDLRDGQLLSSFQAAPDTVNGCRFHPSLNLMATASGNRTFTAADAAMAQDADLELDSAQARRITAASFTLDPKISSLQLMQNSLRIWRFDYSWQGLPAEGLRTNTSSTDLSDQAVAKT